MQATDRSDTGLPSLRSSRHRTVGTAMGLALVNGAGLHAAWAQSPSPVTDSTPVQLAPVSVDGSASRAASPATRSLAAVALAS